MSGVLENTARLSQVIGPRPAGTEEEQQASFMIEESFRQSGLETSVEEFNCNPNYELPRIICCIVSIVLALLTLFLPLLVVPALIVCAIMAALYVMEVMGISPLNNTAKRGISQNVVAKYIPAQMGAGPEVLSLEDAPDDTIDVDATAEDVEAASKGRKRSSKGTTRSKSGRRRKIVVMARYDSGKVCRELKPPIFKVLGVLRWVEIAGIVIIPVSLLLRFLTNAEGALLVLWNILTIAGIVAIFLPVLRYLLHQTAPYTEGANNNAAGVAVMLEVADRIAKSASEGLLAGPGASSAVGGSLDDGMLEEGALVAADGAPRLPVMHGEDAMLDSGMLPVDADLIYEEAANGTLAQNSVQGEALRAEELVREGAVPVTPIPGVVPGSPSVDTSVSTSITNMFPSKPQTNVRNDYNTNNGTNVPDWFKKGIEKANANKEAQGITYEPQAHRSKFADALDAAAVASANSIQEFENRDRMQAGATSQLSSLDERLRQAREQISDDGKTSMAAQAEVAAVAAEIAASEAEAAAKTAAAQAAAKATSLDGLTPEQAVSQAAGTLQADVAAAIGAQQAAEAAAAAQAVEEVAEQAAVADRTISYIPVAANIPTDISAAEITDASAADAVGKSAADVLEEAAAIAGEGAAAKEGSRKKRTISLPSLTGAIEAMNEKQQDAPLAADAERKAGESRDVKGGRKRRNLEGLPSTDLPSKKSAQLKAEAQASKLKAQREAAAAGIPSTTEPSKASQTPQTPADPVVAVASRKEGSTTKFLATTEEKDAKAALSSLDEPVKPAAGGAAENAIGGATTSRSAERRETAVTAKGAAQRRGAASSANSGAKTTSAPSESGAMPSVSAAGSFVRTSSTSQFEPVGDELIADMVEDDIVIHDADDSDYADNITYTGAMAGPGYVNMPKSRAARFRSLFGRKKKESDSISFSEAMGLEDGFDAREVGAARGGWESFQNESAEYDAATLSDAQADITAAAAASTFATLGGSSFGETSGSTSGSISSSTSASVSSEASGEEVHSHRRRSHVDEYGTNSRSLRFKRRGDDSWGGDAWDDDEWNGGAFSMLRKGAGSDDSDEASEGADGSRSADRSKNASSAKSGRGGRGGRKSGAGSGSGSRSGSGSQRRRSADEISQAEDALQAAEDDSADGSRGSGRGRGRRNRGIGAEDMLDEREQIRSFRTGSAPLTSFEEVAAYACTFSAGIADSLNLGASGEGDSGSSGNPDDPMQPAGFQTEVWFVALGAELADNVGIKAFMSEHGPEMHGAIFIDLDALGAGELSLIDNEGTIKHVKTPSRMKRYVQKAGAALGLRINSVKMDWRESSAYYTASKGLQTIHVAGFKDGKPAYQGEEADRFDNISEEKLLENTAFTLELLNSI